jgi:predicted transcriptional regulator
VTVISRRRNRDHLHIISEILEQCQKPRNRTAIMRSLNLSYKMLISYLADLQEAKLLEAHSNATFTYVTTPKGKEYLRKFRELQNIADFSYASSPKSLS